MPQWTAVLTGSLHSAHCPGCDRILHTRHAAEELRVGVSIPAAVAFVPLQVGIERGIFAKHDLDIERADLGGAARAHQALAADSLDIVVAGGPDLALVAKGQHALAVGVITIGPRQTTLIVRNDNPMKAPAELKGQARRHFDRGRPVRLGGAATVAQARLWASRASRRSRLAGQRAGRGAAHRPDRRAP